MGTSVEEEYMYMLEMSWVCLECGELISDDNFWSHPHRRYGDVKGRAIND